MKKEFQEPSNGSSWDFHLYINNQTSYKLQVDSKKLDWGTWYRDSVDDRTPIDVGPGESVQALGIRAARGTATGYECRCVWKCEDSSGIKRAQVDIHIDVPYSTSNSSSLTTSGAIRVEGWQGLPSKGHNFTRSITVSEINGELTIMENTVDAEEKCYLDSIMSNNEMLECWSELEAKVTESRGFSPMTDLPKDYIYPPMETFIGRSEKKTIKKSLWRELYDPIYEQEWQKENYVEEYFSVRIFTLNTNPRNVITIAKGVETVTETSVEVTSSIKNTLEQKVSVNTVLKGTYSGLTAELEAAYSISDVLETSNSRVERTMQKVTIGASDKNRVFVPWVLSDIVAIYRRKKNGNISLLGVSEWAREIFNKVYEY